MMSKKKEYVFTRTVEVTEETYICANSYEEAEDIYTSGGGDTEEVDYNDGDWRCLKNPDVSPSEWRWGGKENAKT
tara:strand:+ start:102 stop:326 length:225 start_codon:yes stop_codon:yes gene_type:complete